MIMGTGKKYFWEFTLIELLVVISIIILLAALLLPSLRSAKEIARGRQCQNNMRQCAIAFTSYAGDYNGFIAKYSYIDTWSQVLYNNNYINSSSVFFCPTRPPYPSEYTSVNSILAATSTKAGVYSYGIRHWAYTSLEVGYTISSGIGYYYIDTKKSTAPSSYLFLADTSRTDNYQAHRFDINTTWSGIDFRHNNNANGLFLDMHVEGMKIPRLHDVIGSGKCYIYLNNEMIKLP